MADATPTTGQPKPRPLSPHLQVYRLPLAALMSITHRLTGVGLVLGSVLLVWWLVAAAAGPAAFADAQALVSAPVGQVLLFCWSLALFYHLANGVRHLVWDSGSGFAITDVARSNLLTLAAALILTVGVWLFALA